MSPGLTNPLGKMIRGNAQGYRTKANAPGLIPFCFAKYAIEQFSIECRKTKTQVITLANHRGHRQSSEPIKARSSYM